MTNTSYWLMKSEPDVYPFERLVKEKKTACLKAEWNIQQFTGLVRYQVKSPFL